METSRIVSARMMRKVFHMRVKYQYGHPNSSKKSRFIKNQKAKGLLSNLRVRTPLTHLVARRRGDVVTTSLYVPATPQVGLK